MVAPLAVQANAHGGALTRSGLRTAPPASRMLMASGQLVSTGNVVINSAEQHVGAPQGGSGPASIKANQPIFTKDVDNLPKSSGQAAPSNGNTANWGTGTSMTSGIPCKTGQLPANGQPACAKN